MVHPSIFERLKDKFDTVIRNPYSIRETTIEHKDEMTQNLLQLCSPVLSEGHTHSVLEPRITTVSCSTDTSISYPYTYTYVHSQLTP